MIPRVGGSANGITVQTQMLLLEARQDSAIGNGTTTDENSDSKFYILMLPVLGSPFRASL